MSFKALSVGLLSIVLLAAGCQLFLGVDPDDIHAGTGGHTGSTSVAGGGGSGGAVIACLQGIDCPGVDDECRARACVMGSCGWEFAAAGTPVSEQAAGDCQERVCDGEGGVKLEEAPSDPLDDHLECTTDVCVMGAPRNQPESPGSTCSEGVCDGAGRCVACVTGADCGQDVCANNRCVPESCLNAVKDGGETAIGCGGPECEPCADGKACLVPSDCLSGVCGGAPETCEAPSCADGVQNGDETDVDCGGSCPERCDTGERCKADGDCIGGSCSGSVCLASCSDGHRNGGETDVDCGGSGCLPCGNGAGCLFAADCEAGLCLGGRCAPEICNNGVKDAYEVDIDCGGLCPPCGPGKACSTGDDCLSGVCAGALCATPSSPAGPGNLASPATP